MTKSSILRPCEDSTLSGNGEVGNKKSAFLQFNSLLRFSDDSGCGKASLLSLPSEILNIIFHYSREPNFIHVCQRLHHVLPPFAWYSKRLVILAYYRPVTNHVYSDSAIDLFPHFSLPGFERPLSCEGQIILQARLCLSSWFTHHHLIIIRNEIMLKAMEEGCRMLELEPPIESFQNALRMDVQHLDYDENKLFHLRLVTDGQLQSQGQIEVHGNVLRLLSPANFHVPSPWPWRMLPATLQTHVLSILGIPTELIMQVAQRGNRACKLLRALLMIKRSGSIFGDAEKTEYVGIPVRIASETALRSVLNDNTLTQDACEERLKVLLEFHSITKDLTTPKLSYDNEASTTPSGVRNSPRLRPMSDVNREASDGGPAPHYIETVIMEGNLIAFRRLIQMRKLKNFPRPLMIRKVLSRAKKNKVPHAARMLVELAMLEDKNFSKLKRRSIQHDRLKHG